MKKIAWVFFFCFTVMLGYSQCNCTVFIPLSNEYEVTRSDTVGDYAAVKIKEGKSITIKFTDTLPREHRPIKIPFKVINYSDTPLVFGRVNWGGEAISVRWSKEPAFKGDTLTGEYVTMSNLNRSYGRFSKTSTVKTNQCRWMVYFRGFVQLPAKKEED